MTKIADATAVMADLAPLDLAEDWDNVGLLLGDPKSDLQRLMTCLTLTPDVVQEAINTQADMIVAHHPLPFRPLKKITTESVEGSMLWKLASNRISVYSAHTAFDSAELGINKQLAESLGIANSVPFDPSREDATIGVGRVGELDPAMNLGQFAQRAKEVLKIDSARLVGEPDKTLARVAVACGSGGSLFDQAIRSGAKAIVTGEATFHDCLKARSLSVGLLLVGHYASERFAMESLAAKLDTALDQVEVWCSNVETDPLTSI